MISKPFNELNKGDCFVYGDVRYVVMEKFDKDLGDGVARNLAANIPIIFSHEVVLIYAGESWSIE